MWQRIRASSESSGEVLVNLMQACTTGPEPATPLVTRYTFDVAGHKQTETLPDGDVTTYGYDDLKRLTTVTQVQGASPLFSESFILNDDASHASATETQLQTDSTSATLNHTWSYDADQRLTSEVLTMQSGGSNAPTPYADAFAYDLANNRTDEYINQTSAQLAEGNTVSGGMTIAYTYNGDDQLKTESETNSSNAQVYSINYTYDANGNLCTEVGTGTKQTSNTYSYDIRNRMSSANTNGTITNYGYDTSSVLVSEGGTSGNQTYYLNDPNNPTGYTKAIEDKTGTNPGAATSSRSYVLGLKDEGQSDATNGAQYLVTDGHGSTRALVNGSGVVVERYDYDAYGDLLLGQHINPSTSVVTAITEATAATSWLFGGDGSYPATGWTYHLARWTNAFWFTQSDFGGYGSNSDPISLHKYLYAGANPINAYDPSGHDFSLVGLSVGLGITTVLTGLGAYEGNKVTHSVRGTIWGAVAGLDTGLVVTEALATGDLGLIFKMLITDAASVVVALAKDAGSVSAISPAQHWEDVFKAIGIANGSLAASFVTAGFADNVIKKYVDGTDAQAWIAGANAGAIQAAAQWASGTWQSDWKKATASVVTSFVWTMISTYGQNDLTPPTVDAQTAGVVAGRVTDAIITVLEKAKNTF
jgi:YD repeat-containing protein